MRTRILLASTLSAVAVLAGCGSVNEPVSVSIAPVDAEPAGVAEATTAPSAVPNDCDKEASLRPGPMPPPGAMPPDSTMARIAERGRLIVGVDQNQLLFGARNPATGQVEGFDIDIAREIARAIFGDPDRIEPRVVEASQREAVLQSGEVDVVVRTFSINCARKKNVAFSSVYFNAEQRILVGTGSGIETPADLAGKKACAVSGTTSQAKLMALDPTPIVVGAPAWTDCLVMLQQGQIDAIGTDGAVLAGLMVQDPHVRLLDANLGVEPYGVGIKLQNEDMVRFVNGMLERIRADGTWERMYRRWLPQGTATDPPPARYGD